MDNVITDTETNFELAKTEKKNEKPEENSKLKSMEFEDILSAVGDYGLYQKRLVYLFLIPTSVLLPFFSMNLIFMVSTPDHWCKMPNSLTDLNISTSDLNLLTRPWENNSDGHRVQSSCRTYALNYSSILNAISESEDDETNITELTRRMSPTWPITDCSNGYQYDQTYYRKTVSTDYNMVCKDNYLPNLIFTLSNAGSAIGTPVLGALSDKIGRSKSYVITAILALASSILTVLVPNLISFMAARALNGSLFPSVYQLPFLILTEMVSPEQRTKMNGLSNLGWVVGISIMPLVAYLSGDWIVFGWICVILTVPYVLCIKYLPESPRWLMSQGRYADACLVLNEVAKVNGKDVSGLDLINVFKKSAEAEKIKEGESYVSPLELFRKPVMRKRFVILSLSWIADSMCYYGFHINVSHLYGNEFLNFFLLAIVELPSYLFAWYLIETRFGRRWSNVGFLLLMGFACLIPMFAPGGSEMLTTVASLVGKFGCAASYMVMYIQSAEIFPTPLRASGMGIAGTMAAIITVFTPFIIYLGVYSRHLPFTIMGLFGIFAGIASIFLPETLNENLPQTVKDGEEFGLDQAFFSLAKKTIRPKLEFNNEKMAMESFAS